MYFRWHVFCTLVQRLRYHSVEYIPNGTIDATRMHRSGVSISICFQHSCCDTATRVCDSLPRVQSVLLGGLKCVFPPTHVLCTRAEARGTTVYDSFPRIWSILQNMTVYDGFPGVWSWYKLAREVCASRYFRHASVVMMFLSWNRSPYGVKVLSDSMYYRSVHICASQQVQALSSSACIARSIDLGGPVYDCMPMSWRTG